MERIFRVQRVKLVGPGLSSASSEKLRGRGVRRKEMEYELSRSVLGRRYDTGKRENDGREKRKMT